MKLNKLIKIINGNYQNDIRSYKNINNFVIDSRKCSKDDIFIAINNGYKYIDNNLDCLCVITDKNITKNVPYPIIKVKDSIIALSNIAKYKRKHYKKTKVIAITGSVGKTTTKELLYNILKTKYKVYKSDKNYNNHIGLPLTLSNINQNYDYILLEMGMNHKGEINYLSNIAKPNIGIITNIGTSHIGNFNTYEDIIYSKLELTNYLKDILFIDKKYNKYINYKNIYYYKDYQIKNITNTLENTNFIININNIDYKINFNIPGIHLINNILICIDVSLYLNIKIEDIIKTINEFIMPENRLNIYKKDFIILDDSYNASLESTIGLLDTIKNIKKEKIIILGDILELGNYSKEIHLKINNKLKEIYGLKLLVGEETKVIDGIHFNNNKEIINYLKSIVLKDKLIILKGSHRMNLKEIKDELLS